MTLAQRKCGYLLEYALIKHSIDETDHCNRNWFYKYIARRMFSASIAEVWNTTSSSSSRKKEKGGGVEAKRQIAIPNTCITASYQFLSLPSMSTWQN